MNITDALREQALAKPDAPAVVRLDDLTVTYRDLERTINACANQALALGLRPGQTAVISMTGSPRMDPYPLLILALALARIGVASAPASLPAGLASLTFAYEAPPVAGARTVMIDPGWYEPPALDVDIKPVASHQDGAAICRIFPSSGTTGIPKHIAISHEMMLRRLSARQRGTPFTAAMRLLSAIGPANHYWFRDALNCLSVGGLQVLAPLVKATPGHRINYLIAPPEVLARFVARLPPDARPLPELETVEVGGADLPAPLAALVAKHLCANIVHAYGSTEAGPVARASRKALQECPGAAGYLDEGVEAQAVDANDAPLAPGANGILRMRGDCCIAGYAGNAEASARHFRGGWFYPGDLGSVSRDGMLTITGRVDELINRGGAKINPALIDQVLLSVTGVGDAASFAMENALGRVEIGAAIVPNGPIDRAALQAHCKARLGMNAPLFFMKLRRLPRNDTGKVMRHELVRIAREWRAANKARPAP